MQQFANLYNSFGTLFPDKEEEFIALAEQNYEIYESYFKEYNSLFNVYNIHDVLKMLSIIYNYYIDSTLTTSFEIFEDVNRRIYPFKYKNGAFRGMVLIPDWPNGSDEYECLKLNHVVDKLQMYFDLPDFKTQDLKLSSENDIIAVKHNVDVTINTVYATELEMYTHSTGVVDVVKLTSNGALENESEQPSDSSAEYIPVEDPDKPEPLDDDLIWIDLDEEGFKDTGSDVMWVTFDDNAQYSFSMPNVIK